MRIAVCSDNVNGPNLSDTTGTLTQPRGVTTPPVRGDAGGSCTGSDCADLRVEGFWAYPTIIDAGGGAQVVPVTQRILNNSANPGNIRDVWEVEAPSSVTPPGAHRLPNRTAPTAPVWIAG